MSTRCLALLILGWAAPASTAPIPPGLPVPKDSRTEFVYTSGKFVKGPGGKWVEERTAGPSSNFTEVARTDAFVELYDRDRDLRVRLHADRGEWHNRDGNRWVRWPGSEGTWRK